MSVPEAGPHTPCTRLSAPWTPSSRRQHLPTPTATSSLWTDGAPTWAAPSPTERHPDRTIPLLERNDPFVDVANPAAFIEKAETETRLKRHTPASGMPHVSVPNATRQRSECHMSTFRMPHLSTSQVWHSTREVWHFPPRSVASEGVKPFMYNHLPDKRTKRQKREDKYVLLSNKTNPI